VGEFPSAEEAAAVKADLGKKADVKVGLVYRVSSATR